MDPSGTSAADGAGGPMSIIAVDSYDLGPYWGDIARIRDDGQQDDGQGHQAAPPIRFHHLIGSMKDALPLISFGSRCRWSWSCGLLCLHGHRCAGPGQSNDKSGDDRGHRECHRVECRRPHHGNKSGSRNGAREASYATRSWALRAASRAATPGSSRGRINAAETEESHVDDRAAGTGCQGCPGVAGMNVPGPMPARASATNASTIV